MLFCEQFVAILKYLHHQCCLRTVGSIFVQTFLCTSESEALHYSMGEEVSKKSPKFPLETDTYPN